MKRRLILWLCLACLSAHFIADGPTPDWLAPAAPAGSLPADTVEPPGQCEGHALGFIRPCPATVNISRTFLPRLAETGGRLVSQPLSPQLPPPKIN